MKTVYRAETYRHGAMGSLGDASCMLITQHQFPSEYDSDLDKWTGWDHDRIMQQQYAHESRCFQEHTGTGELGLEEWVQINARPGKVLAFIKDILEADPDVEWTGYRIMGTVNRGSGYPVWTLDLFSKHPDSNTKVFDTKDAPNLRCRKYDQLISNLEN